MTLTALIIQVLNSICIIGLSFRLDKAGKQADQLRAELEQMKTELSNAQGEARAALLAINQLNSKK